MSDPQKLGKYEVRRQLGRGAMGIVYEGYDPFIQRTVALKTIRKELLDQDQAQEMLARFQREAQAGGRLNHPNIVAIYDYGEDQETAYIAMEFIKGKELKELFTENTRFALPTIAGIMSQLLLALNYSHLHGVVHRDIKPANIIVMDDGQVKIADFGIARLESSNLTQTGLVLGTPNYMSPEQFMGQHVDGRSDLFSAGVVLYQLLTGEKPFVGESTTTIMYQVLNNTPNPPSLLNVQIPAAFDGVVRKALAKRPEDRFQSGQEFLDAITSAAEGKPFYSDVETTIAAFKPAENRAGETGSKFAALIDANKKLWIAGGAIAVVSAIAGIAFLASPRQPGSPAPQIQANSSQVSAMETQASGVEAQKNAAAASADKKTTELPPRKTAPKKTASPEKPQVAEQPGKTVKPQESAQNGRSNKESSSSAASKSPDTHAKQPEKKKGIFGEELKPSQWRKEGELF